MAAQTNEWLIFESIGSGPQALKRIDTEFLVYSDLEPQDDFEVEYYLADDVTKWRFGSKLNKLITFSCIMDDSTYKREFF